MKCAPESYANISVRTIPFVHRRSVSLKIYLYKFHHLASQHTFLQDLNIVGETGPRSAKPQQKTMKELQNEVIKKFFFNTYLTLE